MTALSGWLKYVARCVFSSDYDIDDDYDYYVSDGEEWDPIPGAYWPFPSDGVEYDYVDYMYPYPN